jgi:hypothetical protein
MRLELDAYGMADQSMLGEEDPGAAMDLVYGIQLAPNPETSPAVESAENRCGRESGPTAIAGPATGAAPANPG